MGSTTKWLRRALAELGSDASDQAVKKYIREKDPSVPEGQVSLALRKLRREVIPVKKNQAGPTQPLYDPDSMIFFLRVSDYSDCHWYEAHSLMRTYFTILLIACSLISSCTFKQRTVTFQGTSMLPTIKDRDRLQVLRLDARMRTQLVRGDIVIFKYPLDQTKSYIKRVIGLPGDKLEIKSGEVWLNGVKLEEAYLSPRLNLSQRSHPSLIVPAHAYFIMGDNRDNSNDSRIYGAVPEELIDAKVVGK